MSRRVRSSSMAVLVLVLVVWGTGCGESGGRNDDGLGDDLDEMPQMVTGGVPGSGYGIGPVSVRCSVGLPEDVPVQEVVEASAELLDMGGCVLPGDQSAGAGRLWLVRSGVDRNRFELTRTDGDIQVARLVRPGDGCIQTSDWRGEMVIVLPSDTEPSVRVETVTEGCG